MKLYRVNIFATVFPSCGVEEFNKLVAAIEPNRDTPLPDNLRTAVGFINPVYVEAADPETAIEIAVDLYDAAFGSIFYNLAGVIEP